MKKNIVIDDFGRTPEVSKNILKIINDIPNIKEVSVMMGFIDSSTHNQLKECEVKTSLHINLTDNINIKNLGKNLSFIKLLFLSKKKREFVYKEIDNQIKEFIKLYNLNGISINGHEHVQIIPWIYKYLYNNKNIKDIRYVDEKLIFVFKKIKFFQLIRNYFIFITVNILNLFNKKKSDKFFYGLIHTNNMCKEVYEKIIKKNPNSNIEVLFHPGNANEDEINFFSHKKYYKYFVSNNRVHEFKELYEIKKNISSY